MRSFASKIVRLLVLLAASQLLLAAPAEATGAVLVSSDMLEMFQILGNQDLCITYSYDLNGNIKTRNDQIYGTQGIWGSSVYGCFNWVPSQ